MEIPTGPCPVCGSYSFSADQQVSSLLAVCDVLVFKALETLGRRLVRVNRARAYILPKGSLHRAHIQWTPDDELVTKALKGAWDVVPALLSVYGTTDLAPETVTEMLDSYVHDLAITATDHTLSELEYRFETRLGLELHVVDCVEELDL